MSIVYKIKKISYNISFKFIVVFVFMLSKNKVEAQNWTGKINSDWNNAANWSSWPLNNANIVIDTINYTGIKASPIISNASVFIPRKVLMQNGAQLVIQNNLTTNDNFDVFGLGTLLTIQSGNINIGVANNGRLLADLNGNIIINNGTITTGKSLAVGTGSSINMFNGNVNTLQRLLVDLGGQFIFENGNITVGQRLAVSDGDVLNPSLFQMNGGNLTINAEINLVSEFGNFTPTFNLVSGTLTVNGNILWLGVAPGTGSPQFNIKGGTANINGNIQNTVGSTNNMYLKISDAANVHFYGTLIENLHPTDSIIQVNNSNFFIHTTNIWNIAGVFIAINSKTTFNGNTNLQGVGSIGFDDVLITSNDTLNHVSPLNINITGDFINNGNFVSNLNSINFNGNKPQNIDGSSFTSFNKLYISNTSTEGITVNKSIFVTGY